MPILGALGLGVGILVLKSLTPVLFAKIEETALTFLEGARVSADVATSLAASASMIEIKNRPLVLPQAPTIKVR